MSPSAVSGAYRHGNLRTLVSVISLVVAFGLVSLQGRWENQHLAALDGSTSPPTQDTAVPVPPDACRDTLRSVGEVGLRLPDGVDYRCPSTQFAHHGTACWDGPVCPGGGFIAINLELIGNRRSADYLRHVVAHEVCHILEFQSKGSSTEESADACAAAHGAPK